MESPRVMPEKTQPVKSMSKFAPDAELLRSSSVTNAVKLKAPEKNSRVLLFDTRRCDSPASITATKMSQTGSK